MQYVPYLRWGIIGGLCLLPFLAFIVASGNFLPSMFFPFITGKNFAFRFLIEILLVLYVILAIREPKYRPTSSWVFWAVGGFVAWMGIATVFSIDPIKSFWSNFERMEGYITLLHYLVLFVIAGAVLTAERWWEKFFQVSIVASSMMGVYAVLQLLNVLPISTQSGSRVDTTFGNATYLAVFMLLNVFLTLFLLIRWSPEVFSNREKWMRSLYTFGSLLIGFGLITFSLAMSPPPMGNTATSVDISFRGAIAIIGFMFIAFRNISYFYGFAVFTILLQVITLFFTETRGAALGFVGGIIIAALYIVVRARGGEWALLKKISIGTLVGILALAGLFFALKDTSLIRGTPMLGRLASISLDDPTTMSRFLHIWPMAVNGAMERPITGWGQENFNFIFNKYYSPEMYNQEQWFDRAHNQFLDWFVAGGLPAFLLYISLYVLVAIAIIRSRTLTTPEAAALIGLLAAYAFNNMFVFDNVMSGIYFFLLLAFAHSLSRKELPGWVFLSRPGNDRVIAVVAPIVIVLMLGSAYMLNVPGVSRATTMIDALQPADPATGAEKDPSENLAAFQKALTYGELGRQENVEQLYQFASNAIAPSQAISPQLKQDTYTATLNAGQALMEQRQGDTRLELFTGVFLGQFGQYDAAIGYLEQALEHSRNKQQILFQLGATYLQKGDATNALVQFKKAYELQPAYNDARVFYAMGLYYAGQTAQGDELLEEGFGTVLVDDPRLLQAYQSLGMHDRAIGVWQGRIEKSPNDPQLYMGLASAYFVANNLTATVETLHKVAQMDPSLAAQVQQLITQIENGTLKP